MRFDSLGFGRRQLKDGLKNKVQPALKDTKMVMNKCLPSFFIFTECRSFGGTMAKAEEEIGGP